MVDVPNFSFIVNGNTYTDELYEADPGAYMSALVADLNIVAASFPDAGDSAFYTDVATRYMGLNREDPGFWIDFNETYEDVASGDGKHFFHMFGTHSTDALNTVGEITGFYGHLDGDDATMGVGKTAESVIPLRGNLTWGVAGTLLAGRAVYGSTRVINYSGLTGDGTVSFGYGGYFETAVQTTGTGAITNGYGSYNEVRNQDGAAMTVAYGVQSYVRNQTNGGGIATGYGFRADLESAGAGVTAYFGLYLASTIAGAGRNGLYQAGDAQNFLRGQLAVGTSSAGSAAIYSEEDSTSLPAGMFRCNSGSYTGQVLRAVADATGSGFNLIAAQSNVSDTEFKVRGDGEVYADGAFTGGGADYAEFFEWLDGNPDGEDRVGWTVAIDGGKIRRAKVDDAIEHIIGAVSVAPVVVGDASELHWHHKYLRNDFGHIIMEPYTLVQVERFGYMHAVPDEKMQRQFDAEHERVLQGKKKALDAAITRAENAQSAKALKTARNDVREAHMAVADHGNAPRAEKLEGLWMVAWLPTDQVAESGEFELHDTRYRTVPGAEIRDTDDAGRKLTRRKLNPDYDSASSYLPRSQRPEWSPIGLMGKLRIIKGECPGMGWLKLRDISAEVEEWLVR